jgi:hypothetical protein
VSPRERGRTRRRRVLHPGPPGRRRGRSRRRHL